MFSIVVIGAGCLVTVMSVVVTVVRDTRATTRCNRSGEAHLRRHSYR